MPHALTAAQIAQFIADGFVRVDHAFSADIAAAARRILWRDIGCDPNQPQTWDRPVVRLGHYTAGPFVAAADSPVLTAAGEEGLTLRQLAANGFAETAHRAEAAATGPAGTVYLCHPFLVHSAQPHRGRQPRFLAQPPLLPTGPLDPFGPGPLSPVEEAISQATAPDAMPHGPGGPGGI